MNRDEKIARVLATLDAIETVVTRQTLERHGSECPDSIIQDRINNAIRLYCAEDVARATAALARE